MSRRAAESGSTVSSGTPCSPRPTGGRLERVIANLVVNALAATPPGGYVRLRTVLEGDHAVLSIADSAGSEASECLRTALHEGVRGGLGLRVVRSLATAMHAEIDVAQTVDGSSVKLRLVRVPATDSAPRALVSAASGATEEDAKNTTGASVPSGNMAPNADYRGLW